MKAKFANIALLAIFTAVLVGCGDSSNATAPEPSSGSDAATSSESATGSSAAATSSENGAISSNSVATSTESGTHSSEASTFSSESGSVSSSESGAVTSSESTVPSENTSSSSETAATNSSASELQKYENARAFIDDGWRDECLKMVNDYRATEGVAPMTLADDEKQLCAITQAAADMADNAAHGHFGDCGEWAQNTGPNFSTTWRTNATAAAKYYIKMMWEDEKALVTSGQRDPDKSEDYSYIGHYLNMKKASYSKLACGIAISEDGTKGWFNMNFY